MTSAIDGCEALLSNSEAERGCWKCKAARGDDELVGLMRARMSWHYARH